MDTVKMTNPSCPKCGSTEVVKNGKAVGKQRHKCRNCQYQFTRTEKRGKPQSVINTAIILYLFGLSMNAIAKLLKVSTPAVLYWIRTFARKQTLKPTPERAQVVVLELDEMWHFLEKKLKNYGYGKPMTEPLALCLIGNAAIVISPPFTPCSSDSPNGT